MAFPHCAGFGPRESERAGSIFTDLLLAGCIALAAVVVLVTAIGPAGAAPSREAPSNASLAYAPGTIVISQSARRLYLITEDGGTLSYPVAVGKSGKEWRGTAAIDGKYRNPAWAPPAEVKHDEPWLPNYIPGGSPRNPMGLRALTLTGGEYAIHGTNRPDSIGKAASYGCIRMYNRDIVDLFDRVAVGTPVVMAP